MSVVTWTDEALDQLAEIYVSTPAEERDGLVKAVEEINSILAENAQFEGESRSGNQRIYIHSLIAVTYALVEFGPILVLRVRPSRPRRKDE